jgi:hypothetical protein
VGIVLLLTQSIWVPKLVNAILKYEGSPTVVQSVEKTPTQTFSTTSQPVQLIDGKLSVDGQPLPGAYLNTFTVLNFQYGKDAGHVYTIHEDEESYVGLVGGADPKTFVPLGNSYAKDADHIYWNGMEIQGADLATFSTFRDNYYAKDKNRVYREGGPVTNLNLDPTTFIALNNVYVKDAHEVCYITVVDAQCLIGADPATFILSTSSQTFEAQDKNHKYRNGKIVQ